MAKIKRGLKSSSHTHPSRPKGITYRKFERVYWPYLPVVLIIGLLLSFNISHGSLRSTLKNPAASVLAYATSMQKAQLLKETNEQRSQAQAPSLKINDRLEAAAQAKADDMAKRNYWSHKTPEGSPPWTFVADQHYSYQKLAENLAAGFDNEDSVIKGWMASPAHKANLLDSDLVDVGFGSAQNANYTGAAGSPATIVVVFYAQPTNGQSLAATGSVKGDTTSSATSLAQISLAELPIASIATILAGLVVFGALAMVGGRHFVVLRRVATQGERFVIKHPFLDIGLIVIAALSFLMTRTAGFIS